MIEAVIFDFDGTLADTSELIINSFQTIYKEFHGEEKPVEHIKKSFGEPLRVTLEREFKEPVEDVLKVYKDYQVTRFKSDVKLFDRACETLQFLKSKDIKTAIVTSRMRNSVINSLNDFEIYKYFDAVIAVEDTINHKPHPEPLLKAISMIGTTPEKTLYVGDSKFDLECADRAGAMSVLVGWHDGETTLEKQYNVKYVINNLYEIAELI